MNTAARAPPIASPPTLTFDAEPVYCAAAALPVDEPLPLTDALPLPDALALPFALPVAELADALPLALPLALTLAESFSFSAPAVIVTGIKAVERSCSFNLVVVVVAVICALMELNMDGSSEPVTLAVAEYTHSAEVVPPMLHSHPYVTTTGSDSSAMTVDATMVAEPWVIFMPPSGIPQSSESVPDGHATAIVVKEDCTATMEPRRVWLSAPGRRTL